MPWPKMASKLKKTCLGLSPPARAKTGVGLKKGKISKAMYGGRGGDPSLSTLPYK